MKYYIIKPASHKTDQLLIEGIKSMDNKADIVITLDEADICILQKGWTKSRICIAEEHSARAKGKKIREGYIYTDKYKVKLN